jgi:hypothetical protein
MAGLPSKNDFLRSVLPITNQAFEAIPTEDRTCGICLQAFTNSQTTYKLHGKHYFHAACISEWNDKGGHNTCPFCREPLYKTRAQDTPDDYFDAAYERLRRAFPDRIARRTGPNGDEEDYLFPLQAVVPTTPQGADERPWYEPNADFLRQATETRVQKFLADDLVDMTVYIRQ